MHHLLTLSHAGHSLESFSDEGRLRAVALSRAALSIHTGVLILMVISEVPRDVTRRVVHRPVRFCPAAVLTAAVN